MLLNMKFTYKKTCLLDERLLVQESKRVIPYIQKLAQKVRAGGYNFLESSLNLPSDKTHLDEVMRCVKKFKTKVLKYIVVVGIGGSNLGTKAVYDALFGAYDTLEPDRFPKILFSDTVDSEWMKKCITLIQKKTTSPKEVLFIFVSKSGGTTETIANTESLLSILKKKWNTITERCVVITDEGSKLALLASRQNIQLLFIPQYVGGRYSVFSPVGLFPLALAGIDSGALMEGARAMRTACLSEKFEKNPAFQSAVIHFLLSLEKRTIADTFLFYPSLESLGKWYRQLLAESIGKEIDKDGRVVHCGLTPTVSIGSTDLHSMGQLYLGGPQDKIATFVSVISQLNQITVPRKPLFGGLVDESSGKKLSDIMNAILGGVKKTYQKKKIPFCEIVLENVSPRSLGAFMQFKMMEVMFLGDLFNVNAFDQPNVEEYKIETRHLLS